MPRPEELLGLLRTLPPVGGDELRRTVSGSQGLGDSQGPARKVRPQPDPPVPTEPTTRERRRFRDARASLDPSSRAPSDRPRPSTRRRSSPSRSSSRRRPLGTSRWTARRNERSDEAWRATRRRRNAMTTRTERRRGVEARPGATTRNHPTTRRVRRMSRCGARRSSTKSWTDAR